MEPDRYADDEDAFARHLDRLGVPHQDGLSARGSRVPDRNTEEGALVDFASSLQASNPVHRLVAWILLVAVGLPALLAALHLAGELVGLVVP